MQTIILVCFCAAVAAVDAKTCRIPDGLLLAFALAVTVAGVAPQCPPMAARLAAAFAALLVFGAVWRLSRGLGLGDVKYAAVLGYALGFDRLIPAFIATAVLGVGVYLAGALLFRWPQTAKIPFAPFLSAGVLLTLALPAGGMGSVL